MTIFKLSQLLPCTSFFSEGRLFLGLVALLMQMSLVFWPVAARWANRTAERSGMERMLAELSEAYRLPDDPYARPAKRFRQPA
jgi:hypothetical protein